MLIYGCVRDIAALAKVDIGVLAIGVNPRQPGKRREGTRDIPVTFADAASCRASGCMPMMTAS
jgi:regulator of ribonuclease activity A